MSTPASDQTLVVYQSLSDFYKAVSLAIANCTTIPSIGSIASSLNFTDLETMAAINSKTTPTFSVGSAVETTHLAAAVLREYGMRVKGKGEYYTDGITSSATESDYFDKMKYMHHSAVQGGSISGSLTQ